MVLKRLGMCAYLHVLKIKLFFFRSHCPINEINFIVVAKQVQSFVVVVVVVG